MQVAAIGPGAAINASGIMASLSIAHAMARRRGVFTCLLCAQCRGVEAGPVQHLGVLKPCPLWIWGTQREETNNSKWDQGHGVPGGETGMADHPYPSPPRVAGSMGGLPTSQLTNLNCPCHASPQGPTSLQCPCQRCSSRVRSHPSATPSLALMAALTPALRPTASPHCKQSAICHMTKLLLSMLPSDLQDVAEIPRRPGLPSSVSRISPLLPRGWGGR